MTHAFPSAGSPESDDAVFCTAFDAALAVSGPPAVFLRDPEGRWKMDPEWTRDAWGRLGRTLPPGTRWALARDRSSGYVQLVLITSPELLDDHPRMQVRTFEVAAEAEAAFAAFGRPPLAETW